MRILSTVEFLLKASIVKKKNVKRGNKKEAGKEKSREIERNRVLLIDKAGEIQRQGKFNWHG